MEDFIEELHIERNTDKYGTPTLTYNYCHTKTDLTDDTVQVIDFGEDITIGEACSLITSVSTNCSMIELKQRIKNFLDKDRFDYSKEY